MNTSERIKRLGNFFQKMEISTEENETLIYVAVSFPNGWMVDNKTEGKYRVQTATQQGVTFFWTNIANGEGCVFDAIEYNIKQNREAQEKIKLYNEKVEELRDIFEDESNTIENLRALVIEIPGKKESVADMNDLPSFVTVKNTGNELMSLDEDFKTENYEGEDVTYLGNPKTTASAVIMETVSEENKKGKKNK